MDAIKSTILSVMESLAAKKTQEPAENSEQVLKKVLTKKQLAHIKFNYFRKGILGISVDSSSWLYSLSLQKEKILSELKKEIKSLKDIRFNIG